MPAYQYLALTRRGKTRRGLIEGDSARHARQLLRERELLPLELAEVTAQTPRAYAYRRTGQRLNATDQALIARQLATLIGAGLPLEEALSTIAQQLDKTRSKGLILALRARVMEGHSLAAALAAMPRAFPELYRATVAAGEQSGRLDVVFERLADYSEQRQQTRQKIGLALFYPLLLTLVAVAIVIGLLTYVVPQVVQVFASSGQQLPWLTRALIASSDFLRTNAMVLLSAVILAGFAFGLAWRRERTRRRLQTLALRLPLFGRLLRNNNAARYARTLSILVASGVALLEALAIAAQVIAHLPMRDAVALAANKVKEGGSLHRALADSGYFPPLTTQLIASGEASGRLDNMLERAAQQLEQETDTLTAALLGLFEPLLILSMGALVLIIVLAILLPIFELNQLVR